MWVDLWLDNFAIQQWVRLHRLEFPIKWSQKEESVYQNAYTSLILRRHGVRDTAGNEQTRFHGK